MSNRSRGTDKEREIEKLLTERGWKVHRARTTSTLIPQRPPKKPRWVVHSNDLWGCIDIAALKRGQRRLYIQATTVQGGSTRRGKVERTLLDFVDLSHDDVQIWEWGDWAPGKSWRIWRLREELTSFRGLHMPLHWVPIGFVTKRGVVTTSDPSMFEVLGPAADSRLPAAPAEVPA